jgi:hypothetical protein
MRPDSDRWIEVTPSEFVHEREGLAIIRQLMPERAPFRAWSYPIGELQLQLAAVCGHHLRWGGPFGQQPFVAGAAGKVVLGDGPATATTRVIADATRFQLWGSTVWNPAVANV